MANKIELDATSCKRVASAILYRAVQDYIDALLTDDTRTQEDCESFFLGTRRTDVGDWFMLLADDLDGEELVQMAKHKATAFKKECERHQPKSLDDYEDRKKRKACYFTCPFCNGNVKWVKRKGHKNSIDYMNYVVVHRCEQCGIEYRTLLEENMKHDGYICPTCRWFSFKNRMKCDIFPECRSFCNKKCKDWEARDNE